LGISWGGLMMFGSYNKFHNKINIDASVVSSLDFLTSIIASVVIFSVLGFLSHLTGVPIDKVAVKGQGLAFIVYPTALAELPVGWLWSILFFLMLFFLGLDSEFALLETALTAIYDGYPKLRNHKVKITFFCLLCLLLIGPALYLSSWWIRIGFDGYLWGRICRLVDSFLGNCRIYVDLWIQELLQGYQINVRTGAFLVLEDLLARHFPNFLVGDLYCLSGHMDKSQI